MPYSVLLLSLTVLCPGFWAWSGNVRVGVVHKRATKVACVKTSPDTVLIGIKWSKAIGSYNRCKAFVVGKLLIGQQAFNLRRFMSCLEAVCLWEWKGVWTGGFGIEKKILTFTGQYFSDRSMGVELHNQLPIIKTVINMSDISNLNVCSTQSVTELYTSSLLFHRCNW